MNVTAFAALADPTRRGLLERLARSPASVTQLTEAVPVSQPAVSQHLKVLREAGLVTFRKVGSRHVYRADPEGLEELREYVDSLWGGVLRAFRDHVEEGDAP